MSVTVGLDALSNDAELWDGASDALSAAAGAAGGLTLSLSSLSWAAGEEGLMEVYEAARSRVERLCREGATETGVIAATLREVRAAYEASDAAAQAAFDGMWEPK